MRSSIVFTPLLLAATIAPRWRLGLALPDPREPPHRRQEARECGPGLGSCDPGQCCSGAGYCGTGGDFCDGSSCQLEYSDSCDTFIGPPGESTEDIPRPAIGNVPYGTLITTCTTPGMLALTFDDGPYLYTTQMLDILDDLNVKVTFFVSGNNLGKGHIDDSTKPWPSILRRMHTSGHQIGSHTWSHRDLNQVNSTIRRTEMIYNEMAFRNLFGWFPTYMRPPYLECSDGSGCTALMGELGYHVVDVNLDTKDYTYDDPALIQNAKDRFSQGLSGDAPHSAYINLAHDIHYQTVVNLTRFMVETARGRGYRLATVGECLGDPEENWYRSARGGSRDRSRTPTETDLAEQAYASPTDVVEVSPRGRCGGDSGYTCMGSGYGDCCSYYQYCGSGPEYCGTGCDNDFGSCDNTSGRTETADTTNGLCGEMFGATCAGYGSETCCSAYGFCGSSEEYCGEGCQVEYGVCH